MDGYILYYGLLKDTPWKWLPSCIFHEHLKRAASYYKNIPRDLPSLYQLPDAIPVGTHGNFIRRPEAWK